RFWSDFARRDFISLVVSCTRKLLAATALLIAGPTCADTPAFAVDQVATGVFVHAGQQLPLDAPGHDDIANIGFVVGTRCVAVIDTGGSVRMGRALRDAIRQHTALPVCYVINTHVHVDHVLGNAAFRRDKPQFVGHARLGAALARSRDFFLREYAGDFDAPAAAEQIIAPDLEVKDTVELDLGDRKLRLRAWPAAHTDCDLTVLDETSATLWTGDLLFRERIPVLDGSAKGWLAAIDELAKIPAKTVVPGHGKVGHDIAAALAPERRYLQALVTAVRADLAEGKSLNDAVVAIQVAAQEKSHWLLWDSAHAHNVARVYQELEWE
ncbi:MAG TPA: quinoprotein relay system zinc metallohydrolase 2, partial [Rudaea sp.]|nr:quinoprotein relay system zinc metallohydrolase 2 [Rudaea sp.]